MKIDEFLAAPVMGILRDAPIDLLAPLIDAAAAGGLTHIEITMNTPGAADQIRTAVAASRGRVTVGAGTVLHRDALHAALDAGATFIVMPAFIPDVVAQCVARNIPVFPGALTPHEVFHAWNAGAAMVKVFPAGVFGPSYFKALKGPYKDVKLLACGGVSAHNVTEYMNNGADAIAIGSSVFKPHWLSEGAFDLITDSIRAYFDAISG